MICPQCGKEFKPSAFGQKFCSRFCRNSHEHDTKIKTCVVCGKLFEVNQFTLHQITCSKECRRIHTNEQNRARVACRKAALPTERPKKETPATERPKKETPATNVCRQCGKEFEPSYPTEKFCSDECRFTFYSPELRQAIGKFFMQLEERNAN